MIIAACSPYQGRAGAVSTTTSMKPHTLHQCWVSARYGCAVDRRAPGSGASQLLCLPRMHGRHHMSCLVPESAGLAAPILLGAWQGSVFMLCTANRLLRRVGLASYLISATPCVGPKTSVLCSAWLALLTDVWCFGLFFALVGQGEKDARHAAHTHAVCRVTNHTTPAHT